MRKNLVAPTLVAACSMLLAACEFPGVLVPPPGGEPGPTTIPPTSTSVAPPTLPPASTTTTVAPPTSTPANPSTSTTQAPSTSTTQAPSSSTTIAPPTLPPSTTTPPTTVRPPTPSPTVAPPTTVKPTTTAAPTTTTTARSTTSTTRQTTTTTPTTEPPTTAPPTTATPIDDGPGVRSEWVRRGTDGRLTYKTDGKGNRIMDFSHAGYRGGGVAIPSVPTKITLSPTAGNDGASYTDDSARIQAAIDRLSTMTPDADGFRGALLLEAGVYRLTSPLRLEASGIVLRGAGSNADGGTVLRLEGEPHLALDLNGVTGGRGSRTTADIAAEYVPSGSRRLPLTDASGIAPGAQIVIYRPATEAWIKAMGMDDLVRDGVAQTWIRPGQMLKTTRTVEAVEGNVIVVDAPMTDYIDPVLNAGARVVASPSDYRLADVGVEQLHITGPHTPGSIDQTHFQKMKIRHLRDVWVRDVHFESVNGSIEIDAASQRITFDRITTTHEHTGVTTGAKPANISNRGGQVLVMRSRFETPGYFPFVTQSGVAGPNVLLDVTTVDGDNIEGHQRWATGLLLDNVATQEVLLGDRANAGSGHGWSMGWSVTWNSSATTGFIVQKPPTADNWCIGCTGPRLTKAGPNGASRESGTFEAYQQQVTPRSLYLAQLADRLGPDAVQAIGY